MTSAPVAQFLKGRTAAWQTAAAVAGAGVMAVASRPEIPMWPAPLTLQTFALFVMAGLAGGAVALWAVLIWLFAAALGAPVLAGGAAGMPALLGYSAGFLAGMAMAAWVIGRACERTKGLPKLLVLFLAGHAIVLAVGWVGLLTVMDPGTAFTDGVVPYLPGAGVKSLVAGLVVWAVSR